MDTSRTIEKENAWELSRPLKIKNVFPGIADLSLLKKNWPTIFTYLVVILDLFLLNLSFYIAIYLRFPNAMDLFNYRIPWLFANIIFFPLAVFLGLYRGIFKASLEKQKSQLEKFAFCMGAFIMSYLYLIKGDSYSRVVVVIFLMTMYAILGINHSILSKINSLLVRKGLGSKNTLIVGTDLSARDFSEQLKDIYGDFYKIKGFVKNGNGVEYEPRVEPVIGKTCNLYHLLNTHNIEQVFIVSDSMDVRKYTSVRKDCEKRGVYVKMVSPDIKNLMKKRKITDVTGIPLTTDRSRIRYSYWQCRLKRFFDILFLLSTGIVTVPLCMFIAGLIRLTSRGPVFFKQKRSLYKDGPSFWFYKFRSMRSDADEIKEELIKENAANGALFKMRNDPRVTPIGHFIRKFSLDEFPQFINVLKGEMSIVGPRPLPVKDFEMLHNTDKICYDWYSRRGDAKPGITGLWQISGRSNLSFEEMCLLDLYYIENQSIFFDLEIMFETVSVMLFGKGAY